MTGLILRRLISRSIGAAARMRVLGAFGIVAVLAALGAFFILPSLSSTTPGALSSTAYVPGQAPPATEAFLKGNQLYDAELVWGAYGEQARERFRTRGGSLDEIRRQMSAARERGIKIDEIRYIGGQQLPNGTSMHFYLVKVQNGQTQGQQEHVPYVFTLDGSGKIARVQ